MTFKNLKLFITFIVFLIIIPGCRTTLIRTIRSGDLAKVKKLVEVVKHDVNKASSSGWTPLMEAAYNRNYIILEYLLKNGAKVNKVDKKGWTALFWAVYYGDSHCTKILLQYGSDPNIRNKKGYLAIDYARMYQFTEIEKLLKAHKKK